MSADQQITNPNACPKCGSPDAVREEVDIGVGTLYGPWHCPQCGYDEAKETDGLGINPGQCDDWECNLCWEKCDEHRAAG